ncbi:MAG: hypothetical protein AAGC74_14475 [Verrucomicrobiota bacterium]
MGRLNNGDDSRILIAQQRMGACETSRFDIDQSSYPKDAIYLSFFAVWGILVIAFGVFCFFEGIWVLGVFASLLSLIIPISLSKRNDVDSIVIQDGCIQILRNNKSSVTSRIRKSATLELTLEFVEIGDEIEPIPTLNLWDTYQGYRRRHVLGLFVAQSYREALFEQLVTFFESSNFSVQSQNKIRVEQSVASST